jgi:hypothetical protein
VAEIFCLCEGLTTENSCVVFMWSLLLGGKKIYSSLGKRSNLYGRSMNLTFSEHILVIYITLCGCSPSEFEVRFQVRSYSQICKLLFTF